jgi:hypothetical protein
MYPLSTYAGRPRSVTMSSPSRAMMAFRCGKRVLRSRIVAMATGESWMIHHGLSTVAPRSLLPAVLGDLVAEPLAVVSRSVATRG